jgi:transcriptional regulator with XRE-family HTH domain
MNYNIYPLKENQLIAANAHIGMRLKHRRKELKLTQQSLAGTLNVSYQQVQKYENGDNRIDASRLYYLSVLLGVDISYFFTALNEASITSEKITNITDKENNSNLEISDINPAVRVALVNLVDVMNSSKTSANNI